MAFHPRRRDGKARGRDPHGPYWIYGAHAVRAALGNPARTVRRVLATREAAATLPPDAAPERAEGSAIAALLPPGAVHQGLAALVDPLSPLPLADALAASPGPVLVLDQVTDPRNVGAILRSAAAFGAAAVIVQDRHAPLEGGAMARAAAGALERVPLLRAVNLARTLEALKQAGLWIVGLDAAAPTMLAAAGLGDRRLALVLGAEDEGMRRLTREACDLTVRLPQLGTVESLNVSVAAAIALYAVQHDRLEEESA
ncbi:23S rRNA (guanosine(2251)-2'-O)-methyltransferase RlmB [Elioraea sp.]|uniref:23S rRNA (guanosine(2251)-2'-O)-methyltransferase RlmB n=1 Tax=Elioraea sp. TaxID=2185103 RepID=UPI003F713F17